MPGPKSFVKYDPALGLSSVFKPLGKCETRKRLEVHKEHGDLTLSWSGRCELSTQDEELLLAILFQLKSKRADLGAYCDDPISKALFQGLRATGFYADQDVLVTKTRFGGLTSACGLNGGGTSVQSIRSSLERLCDVTLSVKTHHARASTRILSWTVANDKQLHIAIGRRLCEVIQASQYVKIDLAERGKLLSPTAKTMHTRLSSQIRPGKQYNIQVKTMSERIWGDAASEAPTNRKRQQRVREAFNQLARLPSWTVVEAGNNVYTVQHLRAENLTAANEPQITQEKDAA